MLSCSDFYLESNMFIDWKNMYNRVIKLTIHTATYNRAYILDKVYESLRSQTSKDFEWIVTDDGSTDETEDLVTSWQNEDNGFPIIYNKLPHIGIPRALNSGVNLARTEWFMMLDSDDCLLPDAVEKIISWLEEIQNDNSFAGIGFAKCFPNGSFMKPQIPIIDSNIGYVDATHIERRKYNLDMDMCEVHRTSLFKKYPFQYWKTEKYAPEQLNFNEIALEGLKMRWRDAKLYICEYLPDGQTKDNRLVKNNPMGFAMMYNQNILIANSFRDKVENSIRMTALCLYGKCYSYLFKSNNVFITLLTFPVGLLLAFRRFIQYQRID